MSRRLCSLYGQILPASCPGSPGKAVKFLLYFLEIKRYSVIFYVCKFLINVGQNAHFLYIITQFSSTEIGNFPDDFIFWTRYAIFIHRDRQLSWWFEVFLTNYALFTHTEANFRTISVNERDIQFLSGGFFLHFLVPLKKHTHTHTQRTNQHSMLSLITHNKNPKIAKSRPTPKLQNDDDIFNVFNWYFLLKIRIVYPIWNHTASAKTGTVLLQNLSRLSR